jgi:hypothetical protein
MRRQIDPHAPAAVDRDAAHVIDREPENRRPRRAEVRLLRGVEDQRRCRSLQARAMKLAISPSIAARARWAEKAGPSGGRRIVASGKPRGQARHQIDGQIERSVDPALVEIALPVCTSPGSVDAMPPRRATR